MPVSGHGFLVVRMSIRGRSVYKGSHRLTSIGGAVYEYKPSVYANATSNKSCVYCRRYRKGDPAFVVEIRSCVRCFGEPDRRGRPTFMF